MKSFIIILLAFLLAIFTISYNIDNFGISDLLYIISCIGFLIGHTIYIDKTNKIK